MSLADGRTKLHQAWKQVMVKWQIAQLDWQDAVSRDFEEKQLAPMEPKVISAVQAIDRLAEVLAQARQECS